MEEINPSNELQSGQAGGSHVLLDVLPDQQTLPDQAAQQQARQEAARDPIPDRDERAQSIHGLSTQWGQDLATAWAADPHSEATQEALRAVLTQHWGHDYRANWDLAEGVVNEFASSELKHALKASGLGNSVDVIMLFGAIGVALQQARQAAKPGPGPGAPAPLSPEQEAEDAIAKVMADPAYFDDRHPNHKRVVAESHRLFEARYRK